YSQAIATLAIAKALRATGDDSLREPLARAVRFIETCQNPYGAWRYGVRSGDGDTSVTGWMVHALAAARDVGIGIDARILERAQQFIDGVTDGNGRVGYMHRGGGPVRTEGKQDEFPESETESLTAEGLSIGL